MRNRCLLLWGMSVCPAKMETAAGSWFWLSELCHASANRRVVYNPHSNDDDGLGSGAQSRSGVTEARDVSAPPYHRRFIVCCCILAGDTEGGGRSTNQVMSSPKPPPICPYNHSKNKINIKIREHLKKKNTPPKKKKSLYMSRILFFSLMNSLDPWTVMAFFIVVRPNRKVIAPPWRWNRGNKTPDPNVVMVSRKQKRNKNRKNSVVRHRCKKCWLDEDAKPPKGNAHLL